MNTFKISEINKDRISDIKELLSSNKLPYSDIENDKIYFIGAFNPEGNMVGTAGLEMNGTEGLLRSLAVNKSYHLKGIGKMLHDAIISHALVLGVKNLYLLTTTAAKYFEKNGWKIIDRSSVPDQTRNTTEFTSICPTTAVCMAYKLSMDKPDEAEKIFKKGFNCAQAVFLPFARDFNIEPGLALKLSTGFGAGMVYRGETCGAVTGAMMAIGLAFGRRIASDAASRDRTYALINRFYDEFKEINGSIICKELLKVDLSTEEGKIQAGKAGLFNTVCPKLVKDAAKITEKLIAKEVTFIE